MSAATERYARQAALPEFAHSHERFARTRVGVIGVGGLGALCSYLLAGAGIGELRLSDNDEVSLSNLHRQVLYDLSMLGQTKTACAKQRIAALDPAIQVNTYGALTDAASFANFAKGLNMVLLLTDTQSSRLTLSDWCLAHRLPTLIACVSGYSGMLALFNYAAPQFIAQHGCYRCLCSDNPEPAVQGILGPTAAQLSAATAQLALQFLNGTLADKLQGCLTLYDFSTQSTRRFKLKRAAGCGGCREYAD